MKQIALISCLIISIFLSSCASLPQSPTPSQLNGVVEHPDGTPVGGAWISLVRKANGSIIYPEADSIIATLQTDKQGRFHTTLNQALVDADYSFLVYGKPKINRNSSSNTVVGLTDVQSTHAKPFSYCTVIVPVDFQPRQNPGGGLINIVPAVP